MKSRILYSPTLPDRREFPEETVLFYDSVLAKNPAFRRWSGGFRYRLALKAGENLKTIASFESVLKKITALKIPRSTRLTFVAAGGGSVGDFSGFLAGVFLRGRPLMLLPSTWLSAVDSAHGGKNGLNFEKTKNQIGTFHPPERIFIVDELLAGQPSARVTEALGEVIKIALLADRPVFAELEKSAGNWAAPRILKMLPRLIGLKYRIVRSDPLEKKGHRRLLNLGHTLGHVLESHFAWPHGVAVLLGTQFAVRWSRHLGLLSEKDFLRISLLLESVPVAQSLDEALRTLPEARLKGLLARDKKLTTESRLDFIFLRGIGRPVRRSVKLTEVLREVRRQKTEL